MVVFDKKTQIPSTEYPSSRFQQDQTKECFIFDFEVTKIGTSEEIIIFGNGNWTTSASKKTRNVSQGVSSLDYRKSFKNLTSFASNPIHAYLLFDDLQNVSNKSSSQESKCFSTICPANNISTFSMSHLKYLSDCSTEI